MVYSKIIIRLCQEVIDSHPDQRAPDEAAEQPHQIGAGRNRKPDRIHGEGEKQEGVSLERVRRQNRSLQEPADHKEAHQRRVDEGAEQAVLEAQGRFAYPIASLIYYALVIFELLSES